MSSTEEKPRDGLPNKKSSDSVRGLDASEEKPSPEHATVDTAATAKTDEVPTVGFTELFR